MDREETFGFCVSAACQYEQLGRGTGEDLGEAGIGCPAHLEDDAASHQAWQPLVSASRERTETRWTTTSGHLKTTSQSSIVKAEYVLSYFLSHLVDLSLWLRLASTVYEDNGYVLNVSPVLASWTGLDWRLSTCVIRTHWYV